MKFLYYLSYILWVPFTLVGAVFTIIGDLIDGIADTIHDCTTYKVWLVLHKRAYYKREAELAKKQVGMSFWPFSPEETKRMLNPNNNKDATK